MTELALNAILAMMLKRICAVVSPLKIVLFGSAARGEMEADSDIDLLVIVSDGTHRRRTAQKIYRNMIGVGFAVDLIVVTEEDVAQYKDVQGSVIMPALSEGKVLYASA